MKRIIKIVLFTITVFQIGCYTQYFQTHFKARKDDPIFQLEQQYSISLDSTWTTKYTKKLLKILESISPELNGQPSVWKISNEELQNDIKIETRNSLRFVTISRDVFPIEGAKDISAPDKRFFLAVVQFITEDGTNRETIKQILQERYGISIDITSDVLNHILKPAYAAYKRTPVNLSDIENKNLMIFIAILEEFPQALHKIPQLKYMVCRSEIGDGAAAKAWTSSSFIEFEGSFLDGNGFKNICKTLAHEKSHFLWAHLFPDQLKQDWIKLGGWYKNPESESGWSTNKKRKEFVTDYAYKKNPNEDMAESLAHYLVKPDRLRACCLAKYDFIHERIMLTYGARYMSPDRM